MKTTMYAIIKKDFRGLAANRRLFIALLIVPLILTIVLPSIFLITIHFIPDDPDIMRLLDLLPETSRMDSLELTLSSMILNYILPVFFLVIPIMTASIMAASAFVGEKERHTYIQNGRVLQSADKDTFLRSFEHLKTPDDSGPLTLEEIMLRTERSEWDDDITV